MGAVDGRLYTEPMAGRIPDRDIAAIRELGFYYESIGRAPATNHKPNKQ